jgi:hypothetical protein
MTNYRLLNMLAKVAFAVTLMAGGGGGAGTIDGRAFDVSGNRLPDAEATLLSNGKSVATARSDADRRFTFEGVRAGEYHVQLYLRGFSKAERGVMVRSGESKVIDVWLKLSKITPGVGPWRLSGTVEDGRGTPAEGASVTAIALFERDMVFTTRTIEGTFELMLEDAGSYVLVTHDGMRNCPDARLVTVDGYLKPLDIEMGPVTTNRDGYPACAQR